MTGLSRNSRVFTQIASEETASPGWIGLAHPQRSLSLGSRSDRQPRDVDRDAPRIAPAVIGLVPRCGRPRRAISPDASDKTV
jgi:hypothetical protein